MRGKAAPCVVLVTIFLLAMGEPIAAQPDPDSAASFQRHWWLTSGIGQGGFEYAYTQKGAVPITDHIFVGGRFSFSFTCPVVLFSTERMVSAGPIVGVLLTQGRFGQVSLSSGFVAGVQWRETENLSSDCCVIFCSSETTSAFRAGIPVNGQFFVTPNEHFGIGFEAGYTLVLPEPRSRPNLSIQLMVRIPY